MVPLQLLIFALEVALTTLTSTLEMLSWEGYTSAEQQRLCGLYVPYLALCKHRYSSFVAHVTNFVIQLFSWESTCSLDYEPKHSQRANYNSRLPGLFAARGI